MRITFVLPCFNLSGGTRVSAIYADRLRKRGHHVVAVAPRERGPSLRDILRSLVKKRRWPTVGAPHSHFDDLPVEHRLLSHPPPVTEADVPDSDVIIATWWETAEWVAQMSPAKGAPIHFVQGYDVYACSEEQARTTYTRPMPKIMVSNWLRDVLHERFGTPCLAVVPNSVEADKFFAPPRGKQPVPTVGMLYNLPHSKGTDIGLRAFDLAVREIPGLRLVTMGEMAVTEEMPLPPSAEFIHHARGATVRETYARCDVWVVPSREEGFGLPLLEAMACRTPLVASPAGAAPEILEKGGGRLVPHEDPEAMARAIVEICRMPEPEWRALSDQALANATGYNWDQATDLFETALQEVVRLRAESQPPKAT